jgi:integrase
VYKKYVVTNCHVVGLCRQNPLLINPKVSVAFRIPDLNTGGMHISESFLGMSVYRGIRSQTYSAKAWYLREGLRTSRIPTWAGTELAEASVPLTVLQQQVRHADVKTTLRVYAHASPESQRAAMERASISIGTGKFLLVR